MTTSQPWPLEDENKLRELWGKFFTAREISEAFGGKYTRNSVIGKINRLGLKAHKPVAVRKYRPPKPLPAPKPPELTEPLPLGEPEDYPPHGTCQYIHGDPTLPGWRMRGHPVYKLGSPWCQYHRDKTMDKNATEAVRKARLK